MGNKGFRLHCLGQCLPVFLLACLPFHLAHANDTHCVNLAYSSLPDKHLRQHAQNFALSHDRRLIALYQYFESEKLATFKLWDSQTGKLLKNKKAEDFEERSNQTGLAFAPDDSFIYLSGMTEGIPFWHLAENRLLFSPCVTAMGITDVQFSDDLEVAYSTTNDSFRSLCYTSKEESLLVLPYSQGKYWFDKQTKHLHAISAVASDKSYQGLLKDIGDDGQFISVYKSPVKEYPYKPDAEEINRSFAMLFMGLPPERRLLVAKNEGVALSLSLWDYRQQQDPPEKIYHHTYRMLELVAKGKPIAEAHGHMLPSPDGKQAAFLSNSGVLASFDIASGQLVWKESLPLLRTKRGGENYSFGEPLNVVKGSVIPVPLVIEQEEPGALLLFNWKTGEQRKLEIPAAFSTSFWKQYDQYLLLDASGPYTKDKPVRLLLLDWQTGQRKFIELPAGFHSSPSQLPGSQQLIFESFGNYNEKPDKPFAIFEYNWKTGKSRVSEMPFKNMGHNAIEHVRLDHGDHLIVSSSQFDIGDEARDTVRLYDIESQQYRILETVNISLHTQLDASIEDRPELQAISYDKEKKQSRFCRLPLQHEH